MQRTLRKAARFYLVRRTYSCLERCRQSVVGNARRQYDEQSTLFADLQTNRLVEQLRLNGVVTGLQLPERTVEAIHDYALNSRCFVPSSQRTFDFRDLRQIVGPVPRVHVCRPMTCDSVCEIVNDAGVNEIVRTYLGYVPNHAEPTLIWSLASGPTTPAPGERTAYDASRFHYDTIGYNSVQVLFYITDVNRHSGVHVVIRKSHRHKSLSMVMRSSLRTSQEQLLNRFGSTAETFIEGQRGSGFIEDPACFHRIIHPTRSDRLALRVQYS
jgi:hypothetical protein